MIIDLQHEPLTARIDHQAADYFLALQQLAAAHGLFLDRPHSGGRSEDRDVLAVFHGYTLRRPQRWWILLYPPQDGHPGHVVHDGQGVAPRISLRMPRVWTLRDAVQAAIDAELEVRR